MLALGVGGFLHDYNCCLVDVDKKRLTISEAERLSQRKHHVILDGEDLLAPIRKCCNDLGCRLKDIDTVVFGHTDAFDAKTRLKALLPGRKFVDVDHHLCHAAGAFFSSPYESASVVSIDGFGDGASGLLCSGEGVKLRELERISEEDSIGLEYLRATVHIGLGGHGSEGKTQGLAPYGEPTIFENYMNEIEITPQGNIRLSPRLRNESSRLAEEGGYLNSQLLMNAFLNAYCPRRIPPEPLDNVHKNLAASVQKMIERVVTEIVVATKRRCGFDDLALTGGVCMNSSLNGVLLESGHFKRIFALPMASDRGTGLGAALYYIHHILGVPRFYAMTNVFFGADYTDKEAIKAMKRAGLRFAKGEDSVEVAAKALSEKKIVGWFQDGPEMGARSLGHRSILANPMIAEMKDIINERVKHREWFRPFAPSVLVEKAGEFFSYPAGVADLSYMTFTVKANQRAERDIPATVHVDKTSRVQTVDRKTNPLYAQLIARFADLTGVPVVLNTSFNDKGKPIVETPADAVDTFLKTDMDMLCIGNVIGWKK